MFRPLRTCRMFRPLAMALAIAACSLIARESQAGLIMSTYTGLFPTIGFGNGLLEELNDRIVNNVAPNASATVSFVDHWDGTGATGNFGNNLAFPGNPGNNYGVRATGFITVAQAGIYTFGVNTDDGAFLQINNSVLINDNTEHGPQNTLATINLSAGVHSVDFRFFDSTGGGTAEFFAQFGVHNSFNNGFRLVGDTLNGGLPVDINAVPEPSTYALFGLAALAYGYRVRRLRNKK